ncbi:MAG: hypothetical protein AB7O26_06835 [Planctomycetaceae bacterium]
MGETLHVGLNETQRELLLRGLRYVRSSVMLEVADPTPEFEAERSNQLQQISTLVSRLNSASPPREAAKV